MVVCSHIGIVSSLSVTDDNQFIFPSQVLVNSNLGCKVSGFRPLQEDKIEAIYTTLVVENSNESVRLDRMLTLLPILDFVF